MTTARKPKGQKKPRPVATEPRFLERVILKAKGVSHVT